MKIGELSKQASCTPETVRFYEQRRLLTPPRRTASGYRDYDPCHADELIFARHCRTLGLTLEEVGELLLVKRNPENACGNANRLLDQRLGEVRGQIASLRSLMRNLQSLRDQCGESRRSKDCGILRKLAERDSLGSDLSRAPRTVGLGSKPRRT
jgi:DNA-binding transcriptional MerR regulator